MENQKCDYCHETKALNDFYLRKDTGKHTRECRVCKQARSRLHYAENTERHAAIVKRRYEEFGRFERYRLTPESFAAILAAQGGCCALCQTTEPGGKGKWPVDHAHPTGQTYHGFKKHDGAVRGLLCHRCNQALGFYENLLRRVGVQRIDDYIEGRVDARHLLPRKQNPVQPDQPARSEGAVS